MSTTPNMSLTIPVVGGTPGPEYASEINESLTLIDAHDHTPGFGVAITPAAMDINDTLDLQLNPLINVGYITLEVQSSTPGANTIYESGADLFFVDGVGNNVRITQNGGIAGSPGSIANLAAPASAAYVAASSKFVWQSNTNIAADMDFGAAIMRNLSPNSTFALTLQPPSSLANNYSLTLPTIPVSKKILTLDTSGNIVADTVADDSTIEITSNIIQVKNQGITAAKILNNTITTNQISLTAGITQGQLANTALAWKTITISATTATFAVRVATTVNGTFATAFDNGSVVDGVTLSSATGGDLILIKNQTVASENGVYRVQASGAPVRDTAYDTIGELNNAAVTVTAGTTQSRTSWYQNNTLASLSDDQSWSINSNWTQVVPTGVNQLFYAASGGGAGGGGAYATTGGGVPNPTSGAGGSGAPVMIGGFAVTSGETLSGVIGGFGRGGNGGASGGTGNNTSQNGTNGGFSSITSVVSGLNVRMPGGSGGGGGLSATPGTAVNTPAAISSYDYWQGTIPTQAGTAGDGAQTGNGSDANQNIYTQTPATGGVGTTGGGGGAGGSSFGAGGDGGHSNNSPGDENGVTPTNPGSGGGGAGGKVPANSTAGKRGGDGAPGQIILYYLQGA